MESSRKERDVIVLHCTPDGDPGNRDITQMETLSGEWIFWTIYGVLEPLGSLTGNTNSWLVEGYWPRRGSGSSGSQLRSTWILAVSRQGSRGQIDTACVLPGFTYQLSTPGWVKWELQPRAFTLMFHTGASGLPPLERSLSCGDE